MSIDGGPPPGAENGDGQLPATREVGKTVVLAPGPMASQLQRRPDWLVGQLPVGMLDDNFFYRFVSIFQEEAGTYLDDIDNLPNTIDPAVAPPGMVRFMASWLALPPINPALDEKYQRRLVLEASKLQWWRGTKHGLAGLLELFTDGAVEVVDSGGVFRQGETTAKPPRVTVRVDRVGWLAEAAFVELVRDEIPANVDLQLFVGDRQVFPTVQASRAQAPVATNGAALNGNEETRPGASQVKEVSGTE
jgi:phage tail-like protein